jgi:hypothetical protein
VAGIDGFRVRQLEGLAMMKKLALAVAVVGCLSASAFAADGRISQGSLAHMGLQGMTTMSDAQGMHIRGMSFMGSGGANINVWINAIAIGGNGGGGGNGGNGGNYGGGNGGNGGNANGGNATNNISVVVVTVINSGSHHR